VKVGISMIVIIDYQSSGNPNSIKNMLKHIGLDSKISNTVSDIENADRLILPGIGAFDNGMNNLYRSGLIDLLTQRVIEKGIPVLGICLGMQLFTHRSEEGRIAGLGWIDAETVRFKFNAEMEKTSRIPHMGWNTVDIKHDSKLFKNIVDPRFYFAHSYHVAGVNEADVAATSFYGYEFVSSIIKENIIGVQFHPEKSHKYGMVLLKNFAEYF